jgi:hypothetical protein
MDLQVDLIPDVGRVGFAQVGIVGCVHVIIEIEDHPVAVGGPDPALVETGRGKVLGRGDAIVFREIAVAANVVACIEGERAAATGIGAAARPLSRGVGIVGQPQLRIEFSVEFRIEYTGVGEKALDRLRQHAVIDAQSNGRLLGRAARDGAHDQTQDEEQRSRSIDAHDDKSSEYLQWKHISGR